MIVCRRLAVTGMFFVCITGVIFNESGTFKSCVDDFFVKLLSESPAVTFLVNNSNSNSELSFFVEDLAPFDCDDLLISEILSIFIINYPIKLLNSTKLMNLNENKIKKYLHVL